MSHISVTGLDCLAKKRLLPSWKDANVSMCAHCMVEKQRRVSIKHHSSLWKQWDTHLNWLTPYKSPKMIPSTLWKGRGSYREWRDEVQKYFNKDIIADRFQGNNDYGDNHYMKPHKDQARTKTLARIRELYMIFGSDWLCKLLMINKSHECLNLNSSIIIDSKLVLIFTISIGQVKINTKLTITLIRNLKTLLNLLIVSMGLFSVLFHYMNFSCLSS